MAVNIKKEFGNNRSRQPDSTLIYGKIPPQEPDYEINVLGALLQNTMSEINLIPGIKAILEHHEYFYIESHQKVYQAILELDAEGAPVDAVTVARKLNSKTELEMVGGNHFLMTLITNANFWDVAGTTYKAYGIKEAFNKREAIKAFGSAINDLYSGETTFHEVADLVSKTIDPLASDKGADTVHISVVVEEMMDFVRERMEATTDFTGIDTGIHKLNQITKGWQPADLIILAARPSVGKTALGLNFAHAAAASAISSAPGCFFSLEMPRKQLLLRMASTDSEIPLADLKDGRLDGSEMEKLLATAMGFKKLPFYLNDNASLKIDRLCSIIETYHRKYGIGWAIIDYLQLIEASGKTGNREQEIAEISRKLKKTAKKLNIPIIALAQINRGIETRAKKEPFLSDLRESGAIEQDADMVMFIYTEDKPDGSVSHRVKIAKHRNGTIDDIELQFIAAIQKWQDIDMPFHSMASQNAHAGFSQPFTPFKNTGNNYNPNAFNEPTDGEGW